MKKLYLVMSDDPYECACSTTTVTPERVFANKEDAEAWCNWKYDQVFGEGSHAVKRDKWDTHGVSSYFFVREIDFDEGVS